MSKKQSKKIVSLIVLIIAIFSFIFNGNESMSINQDNNNQNVNNEVNGDLKIYFIDVGQADSILISNQDTNILIDAGNNEDGPKLVTYLQSLNIINFDYVIGTHPHEDHIGGLDDIINNFNVENVMLPDAYTTTKTFEDVLDAIETKNLEITVPSIGDNYTFDDLKFEVMYVGSDTSDLNNTSIVLKMLYGNTSYLFTGDATSSSEKQMLDKDIDVDVLKVGHHGSSYSTTDNFLKQVTPKYAIISVAEKNSYGHPSESTLTRLKNNNVEIYQTSKLGTILLTSNGEDINITNMQTDTNG